MFLLLKISSMIAGNYKGKRHWINKDYIFIYSWSPCKETILLPYTQNHFPCSLFHMSATDFYAVNHPWLSCFFCPAIYSSSIDHFSIGTGLENILTLKLSIFAKSRVCKACGLILFCFVQRRLLKPVLCKEVLFWVGFGVCKSDLV